MKKKSSLILVIVAALLGALIAGPVFGESGSGPANDRGFRALSGGAAADFVVPADMELVLRYDLPAYGLTYERYQQFFGKAHAEVLGGQITLYKDRSGNITGVIGNHYPAISPTNANRRSNDKARDDVARDIGPGNQVNIDLMIHPETGRYFHRVETRRRYVRWFHWLDAGDGKVIKKYNGLAHCGAAIGEGCGVKGDVKSMAGLTTQTKGPPKDRVYWLQSGGDRQLTYDAKNNVFLAFIMEDPDDKWVKPGGTSPGQPAGVDAQYYAKVVDDYYQAVHGRNSFDSNGASMISIVHLDDDYNNAFWDGNLVAYGDGDGNSYQEFSAALDVVGHEWTHAVTDYTSNLVYQDASGALNESFSDMMGSSIEFYAQDPDGNALFEDDLDPTVAPDWFLGEDIDLNGDGFRNMADPEANGSIDGYFPERFPDHYSEWFSDPLRLDGGGVHINSGISNHWFYLLAVGGLNASCASKSDHNHAHCTGGMGDVGNPVTGIGVRDAGKISYLTFIGLPQNATFRGARQASQVVAEALFGVASQQANSNADAWDAVGVKEYQDCDEENASIPFGISPYDNEIDCMFTFSNEEDNFSFHFDLLDLEGNFDFIYIMDANDQVLETLTGKYPDGHTTVNIPTKVGKVRIVTDQWVTAAGFNVDGPAGGVSPPVNQPPTADAGGDQSATTGDKVQMDGSGSTDPEDDQMTYSWSLTVPAGSAAMLSNTSIVNPTFDVDVNGEYVVTLVVNDGTNDSTPDSATVTVAAPVTETIIITKATYNSRRVELKVEATSSLGGDLNTSLRAAFYDGLGWSTPKDMMFNANKGRWSVIFDSGDALPTGKPEKVQVSSANAYDETTNIGGK